MKVQHDTVNDSNEKPVDQIEETNQELSQYSSTLTDIWTAKDSRQSKNPQKPKKRHRFPPSLLSSRAVDFWNTLMPLRANCSCSSVSIGDKCSRLSFGVSSSDATFDHNLESSVSSVQETTVRETLGDTLENTHLAFKLLIGRMVRLLSVLNKKSDSSLSHVCSDPNLKILPLTSLKLKESTKIISRCRFSSITSISSNSSNFWSTGRTGKKSESSTTFEIAEQKRRGRGSFPQKAIVPKNLRVTKSVLTLTKEELVFLLQYKHSLLSEYFQRNEVDSTDLKEKLESSDKNSFIYCSQSDSGLQEHDLLQFVQFIRARKKQDAEDIIKIDIKSLSTRRPETRFKSVHNEDSHQISIPKRRVTFSDPITDESMTVLDCDSTDNDDGILSAQNSATAIISYADIERGQFIRSDDLDDSKSSKTCFANPSLDSLSAKAHDQNLNICDLTMEQTNYTDETMARENRPCYDISVTENESEEKVDVEKSQPFANEDRVNESWSTSRRSSLQKGRKSGNKIDAEKIEEEMLIGLKFLVKEKVDCGTTHVPMSEEVFDEFIGQKTSEKCLKRKTFDEKYDSIDYEHRNLNNELENESIRSKITGCSNVKRSKIPVKYDKKRITWSLPENQHLSDITVDENRPFFPSGKTVTFQDSCRTISDESIISDKKELEQSDHNLVPSSESNERFELSWKGCWDQQSTPKVVQSTEKFEDNFTKNEGQSFDSIPMGVPDGSGELTSIEMYREEPDPVSRFDNDVQSADDHRSKRRSRSLRASSPSSFPYSSDSSVFREKYETVQPDEDSQCCNPTLEFKCGYKSDSKSIEFSNRTELRRNLDNVYEGIRNPEIWRAEVRPAQAKAFSKSDWYARPDSDRYPWKIPRVGSDWLIKKLEELQSSPETDYESDYYAESEMSDFECGRDLSLVKRSFSNLNAQFKNFKSFKTKRSRFDPNVFLNNVWSGKKFVFNEYRRHKRTPSNRPDLRPGEHDLRHTSFQDSDQRSRQNIFSHLRRRLILDSETDDSDSAPSIQPDFYYNFNRRDEHVNKIKSRRFVRSVKNIKSEEDRRESSTGLLHAIFKKSFTPASVQCAFPTRTVGTNFAANMMDVSIDTYDLCPRKPTETTNQASKLSLSKDNISCQTVEKALQDLQVPKTREQRLSSTVVNLSTQINDASNNLEKLRFSEIKTQPDLLKSSNLRTNSDSCTVNQSSCPICNVDQKPTPRYALPACIVKGVDPGSKANEKDPWNRVMARAKAQHRYEGRNESASLEMKPSTKSSRTLSSASTPVQNLKFSDKNDNCAGSDHFCKEEVRIELVQVQINSSEVGQINSTPMRKYRQRRLQPPAAVSFPISSNANFPMPSLPRTRSPRRPKKPEAIANTNRLLYIISEKAELTHLHIPIKSTAANFFN